MCELCSTPMRSQPQQWSLIMFYSIRFSRYAIAIAAFCLISVSLAEIRNHPQELGKRSRFVRLERVAKMGVVISVQQSAQQTHR
ncbi:MAG: hypothetical protein SW833_01375 [Cyanobacteriota bacterium]|nr:hypothetical protein [Cyanobacteriota bacterium]